MLRPLCSPNPVLPRSHPQSPELPAVQSTNALRRILLRPDPETNYCYWCGSSELGVCSFGSWLVRVFPHFLLDILRVVEGNWLLNCMTKVLLPPQIYYSLYLLWINTSSFFVIVNFHFFPSQCDCKISPLVLFDTEFNHLFLKMKQCPLKSMNYFKSRISSSKLVFCTSVLWTICPYS